MLLQLDDTVNLSVEDTTTVSSYKLSKSTHLIGNHIAMHTLVHWLCLYPLHNHNHLYHYAICVHIRSGCYVTYSRKGIACMHIATNVYEFCCTDISGIE